MQNNNVEFMSNVRNMIKEEICDFNNKTYAPGDIFILVIDRIERDFLSDEEENLSNCGKYIHAMQKFVDYCDDNDYGEPYDLDSGLSGLYHDAVIALVRQEVSYILCALEDDYPEDYQSNMNFTVDETFFIRFVNELYDEFYQKIENFFTYVPEATDL